MDIIGYDKFSLRLFGLNRPPSPRLRRASGGSGLWAGYLTMDFIHVYSHWITS